MSFGNEIGLAHSAMLDVLAFSLLTPSPAKEPLGILSSTYTASLEEKARFIQCLVCVVNHCLKIYNRMGSLG